MLISATEKDPTYQPISETHNSGYKTSPQTTSKMNCEGKVTSTNLASLVLTVPVYQGKITGYQIQHKQPHNDRSRTISNSNDTRLSLGKAHTVRDKKRQYQIGAQGCAGWQKQLKQVDQQKKNQANNQQLRQTTSNHFNQQRARFLGFLPESRSESDNGQGGLSKLGSHGRGHSSTILGHHLFSHDFHTFSFV
jgi:hypothetical protein